jgi:Leucine-rich repeat (LRR) protein
MLGFETCRRTHEYIKKNSGSLNLSKRGIKRIEPEWIPDMRNVDALNLSFNSLQTLPKEFAELVSLVSLDLVRHHSCWS